MHLTNHGYMMNEDYLSNAYNCLHAITNIHRKVARSGGAPYFYPNGEEDSYFEDVDNWYSWYEQNKCTITVQKADSLIRAFSILDGNEYDWPLSIVEIVECN
ncbi:hypothetical protein GXP67_22245 [Rhodocytophaga rosea]|uniref:Uncharacterized protein n=1 Tax=Rhodocytophaga rosea TaxID=2704465 RepID=A0A6C0GM98_9BACT|nr:hypothetical protein [Rhodocytophaga rosea]QHT69166.1 hypothetical protein GXP67_22245 [Rhodocytophaga rosea]